MLPTGWCPGDRSMADMQAMYPNTSAVRIFFQPGEGLPASAWTDPRQELAQAPPGSTVIVSHKDVDVDARAFVDAGWQARPDVRCVLLPHHEPEQQTGGDPTPAQFDASWTRTAQQVGAHPARAEGWLRLAVCYTLVWVRQGNDWRKWFPDHVADAVDLVLGDWYPYDPTSRTPWKPTVYEDPASALAVLEDIAAATGKGWGIGEINHSEITKANGYSVDLDPTGVLCADWYRRMHAHAKARGCQVWTHFHRGGGDLGNRPAMQQALRDLIGQEAPVTTAPQCLKDARALLLAHLDIHPGETVSADLDPAEVGIVGNRDHWGGYHCGRDRVVSGDYSVTESSRDRDGLTYDASALDVGSFRVTTPAGVFDLAHFSRWVAAECAAGAPDTKDIREVIYSPDGQTVKRWDRLGKRSSGDDSHLWHTHISYHRDAIKAGRDQTALFARYLTEIGLLEDDMPTAAEIAEAVWSHPFGSAGLNVAPQAAREWLKAGVGAERAAKAAAAGVATLRTEVADGFGRDLVDEAQVAGQLAPALLAVLTPEAIVAAIPGELAEQVADVLAARLAS